MVSILAMSFTLTAILLNIGGGNTRGDSVDVTDRPWKTSDSDSEGFVVKQLTDISHTSSLTPAAPNEDKFTTLKDMSIHFNAPATAETEKLINLEAIVSSSSETPSVTVAASKENSRSVTEQMKATTSTIIRQTSIPKKMDTVQQGAAVNRLPRQGIYYKGSNAPNQKPGFQTARGKNWCAYVHTRLLPTAVIDTMETYVASDTGPCSWNTGSCSGRNRLISQPIYRMSHKIVTSLEWKCCPGYRGEQCQLTAQQVRTQIHRSQAESSLAGNSIDIQDKGLPTDDIAVHQKLSDQIYSQEKKLNVLKIQVENISTNMSNVHSALYSLEEKINEDYKGKGIQSFLKELNSKTITELITEIVKDQLAEFQRDTQESIAQLYKSMSGISIELEKTKETVKVLNSTVIASSHNCTLEQENKATMDDILELKNHMEHLKNIAAACNTSFKDMEERYNALETELEHERSRSSIYFESLNSTLSKMKEIHGQLLSDNYPGEQLDSAVNASVDNNITEYLLSVQGRVKMQNIMMLQMYNDINAQDSKINNLSITVELHRLSIERACTDRFKSCKEDFQKQMKDTENNVLVLNKTVSDVVLLLDDKIDNMKEQISDLCYDMEILQPLIEKGVPFLTPIERERQSDVENIKREFEDLTTDLENMSIKVEELIKGQEKLEADAKSREHSFDKRINECLLEAEDGFNKTMDIINNAIDSIQDNYMLKSERLCEENESQLNNDTNEKLEKLFVVIPMVMQINETLKSLINRKSNKPGFELDENPTNDLDNGLSSSFFNLSQKVNQIMSTLDSNQLTLTKVEEELQRSDSDFKTCQSRLMSVESQVLLILANPTTKPKSRKEDIPVKDKGQQELSSRIKALEFKTIRLSASFPPLNKTVYEAQNLCQIAFINIKKVNESILQLIKTAQPNITNLQRGFEELIKSLIDVRAENIFTNVTSYVDKTLKQMKVVPGKKTVPPKKPTANSTSSTMGRSQRNSDINDKDFSKGSYRFAPIVAFFVAHTYGMTTPGPIRFNNLLVNYGSSYAPSTGKFHVPYLGVYIFKYTVESFSPRVSGYLVVDGIDKIAFQSENINNSMYSDRMITGDALLELNYGQEVWLRLTTGSIPAQYPPVTTFSGYLLYRT
uniref:Multimerin 1 n=1 Tax=Xenopus tropicalis TaxID=8364 RepID=F7D9Y9_XENTR